MGCTLINNIDKFSINKKCYSIKNLWNSWRNSIHDCIYDPCSKIEFMSFVRQKCLTLKYFENGKDPEKISSISKNLMRKSKKFLK